MSLAAVEHFFASDVLWALLPWPPFHRQSRSQ